MILKSGAYKGEWGIFFAHVSKKGEQWPTHCLPSLSIAQQFINLTTLYFHSMPKFAHIISRYKPQSLTRFWLGSMM